MTDMFIVFVTGLFGAHPPDAAAEAVALLDRAKSSRQGVTRYHLVVEMDYSSWSSEPPSPRRELVRYEVWSDSPRTRCDQMKTASDIDPKGIGVRHVWCLNAPRPGYIASTRIGPGFVSPLNFRKADDASKKVEDMNGIAWSDLGLLNADLNYYSVPSRSEPLTVLRGWPGLALNRVVVDGHPVYHISAKVKNGAVSEVWLRPDLGMNPVRFRIGGGVHDFVQETTATYAKVGDDLWYPTSVRHTRTSGGQPTLDETVTITTAEINRPIPQEVFTLPTFGMPRGTPIGYPEIARPENRPTWDGENVDPNRTFGRVVTEAYDALRQSQPPVPDSPEPGRRLPYYLGGGLLALVGGGLLYAARRRRAAA